MLENLIRLISVFFAKILQRIPYFKSLVRWLDPNEIRKRKSYDAKPIWRLLRWNKSAIIVDINDHIGYRSFIQNMPFEMTVYNYAKRLGIGKDEAILDIGANTGHATIPYSSEFGSTLVAIEASMENSLVLMQNILINKIRAKVFNFALTDSNTEKFIKLYKRKGNSGAYSIKKDWNPGVKDDQFEIVPQTTLNNLSDLFPKKIGLIKIDVEGSEYEVINGGIDFITTAASPIIMEYRIDLNSDQIRKYEEIFKHFPRANIFSLDHAGNHKEFDRSKSYENIVIVPENKW